MKTQVTYNYFTATLTAFNGTNGRTVAEVSGCWDNEAQAEAALEEKCAVKEQDYADRMGMSIEEVQNQLRGWLNDYQRSAITFSVTPSLNGKLVHELTRTLNPGQLPDWTAQELDALGCEVI